jgi:23S rRNA (uracil1939-C5)-methyltransferase
VSTKSAKLEFDTVAITKLVHGGQGLGELSDGRKVFVWNALPGETVAIRVIKNKRSYAEAIAAHVIEPSKQRIAPNEENYLATSPWQIMNFASENEYKKAIVEELFAHEKVSLPKIAPVIHGNNEWQYRNKMEYSFWGDNDGIHLALHQRASHGKQIVTGSKLALPAIDAAANAIAQQLSALNTRAGDLKTIMVRCNQQGQAVGALFTKLESFTTLALPKELQGLRVYHSNPKSPASVRSKLLYELGDPLLQDELLGQAFRYDVDSFFQVNVPIFEIALTRMKEHCHEPFITDMYAGVGTIGLSIAGSAVDLIELDPPTARMAEVNAAANKLQVSVIETSSEKALQYITADRPVIFDPPRAGLHDKVVEQVLEVLPPKIIYLSCNPATQTRDLAKLQTNYVVELFEIYNFFPRTPHIETLAILVKI